MLANQWRALLSAINSNDADNVLGARIKVGEGDGIPRGRHSILPGSSDRMLGVMADELAVISEESKPVGESRPVFPTQGGEQKTTTTSLDIEDGGCGERN